MVLDDPDWPILTSMPVRAPARVHRTAELDRVWLSPGGDIAGVVVDSVIGPGVRIERGAVVRHSVIMGDAVVRAGATVSRAVLAERVIIGRDARVGAPNATNPVLIGAHRRVRAGETLTAGTHVEPSKPRDLLTSTR
jgi:glucose-1-phosphate adenylyltransferase